MSEQNPKIKRKNVVIACITLSFVVIATVALLYPMVPVQRAVLVSRTLQCSYSDVFTKIAPNGNYGINSYDIQWTCVNVTNRDSEGGTFTVTIDYWNQLEAAFGKYVLYKEFTKSCFIGQGETETFSFDTGMIFGCVCTCGISAPVVQAYENQTEYESVLNYLIGK